MSIIRTTTGRIHLIDDEGFRVRASGNTKRNGNYLRYLEFLLTYGRLATDELALIFDRRKPAISAAMRYLERQRLTRRAGEYRSLPGRPIGVWEATDLARHTVVIRHEPQNRKAKSPDVRTARRKQPGEGGRRVLPVAPVAAGEGAGHRIAGRDLRTVQAANHRADLCRPQGGAL